MLGIRLTMVVPNTMRLVEHDDGTFSVSVNIDGREFDTMSVMNAKQERAFWIDFQDRIELLSNDPDNLEGIEKAAKNRAEMLANGYASLMEKAKMNEKYGIMLSAFEDAGEEGLTLEELCEECFKRQWKNIPIEVRTEEGRRSMQKNWENSHRAMKKDFVKNRIVYKTDKKRPTINSIAKAKAQNAERAKKGQEPIEPKKNAEVYRKRNLAVTDDV